MRRDRMLMAARCAPLVGVLTLCGVAEAQPGTTPPQPAAAQPTLPQPLPDGSLSKNISNLGSELGLGAKGSKPLTVRKHTAGRHRLHHYARYARVYGPVDRPALAGVQVLVPLPHPPQPPHLTVPTPAYPLENVATFFTTPAPPVVCHRAPRDPDLPDPHLHYETTVVCAADNP